MWKKPRDKVKRKLLVLYTNLSKVNEVHEGCEVCGSDIAEEEDGVLGGVDGAEDVPEISAAGAENDPVGLHRVALHRQRDIGKVLHGTVQHNIT